ncbi:hypothetical protein EVAR_18616_1 [Eumeta japonica]|uniref:Uncharacterized protein n=1 Tax=Eumeta variegata TaxID=151549 RepID=A0A4C1V4F1_EUMVA|nr:hypothetical protein EVAR_18616_1 [Eumeta japonica]
MWAGTASHSRRRSLGAESRVGRVVTRGSVTEREWRHVWAGRYPGYISEMERRGGVDRVLDQGQKVKNLEQTFLKGRRQHGTVKFHNDLPQAVFPTNYRRSSSMKEPIPF